MEHLQSVEKFFKYTSLGIMILDKDRNIIKINPAYLKMTGYSKKEVLGQHISLLRSEQHPEEFHKRVWKEVSKKGVWEGELWCRKKNGELYLERRNIFVTENEESENSNFVVITRNITESRSFKDKYNELNVKDIVTNLPNKHVFEGMFERVLLVSKRRTRKTALVVLDVDAFNKINKSFGYNAGDNLLKDIAQRIKYVGGEEVFMTRLGGAMFTFFIAEADNEERVAKILGKIAESFGTNPFSVEGKEVFVTISMGISYYPNDGKTMKELLNCAEAANIRAKEHGINTYEFYKPELNMKVFEKLMLETSLRKAIQGDELVLHYQPQVDIETGLVVGVESLIRWNHPEWGLVPPYKFIPLAEEVKLIIPIGDWVLKEACMQNKRWQEEGFEPVVVSVNISPLQFQSGNLVKLVEDVLTETKLEPKYLDIEITESALMKDIDESIEIMKQLKKIGVKISIDDFGTGYSSLSYLTKLPVDSLKIDRSFIYNVENSKENRAITSIIIDMAHELNLEVVAEGVESSVHLEFLKGKKCQKYQGYYFSPPKEVREVEKLLLRKNPNNEQNK